MKSSAYARILLLAVVAVSTATPASSVVSSLCEHFVSIPTAECVVNTYFFRYLISILRTFLSYFPQQQLVTNDNGDLTLEPGQGKTVQCVGSLVIREGDADQLDVGAILTKNSATLEKNKADIEALWTALTVSHA